jgi:spore maturation protein CgeB
MGHTKILLFEWNGIMQRDIKAVLRKMGIEVRVMGYDLFSSQKNEEYFFTNLIHQFNETSFDAMMSVHFFPIIAKACYQKGIPYLCWIYDAPFVPYDVESFCLDNVYSFIFDRSVWEDMKKMGAGNTFHVPLAVNVERLNQIESTSEDVARHSCDASFVGQSYRKERNNEARIRLCGRQAIEDTICERMEMMKRVSEVCDFAWYSTEKAEELPLVKNRGSVGYYSEMPKVFKLSKININVTLKSILSGIPLRILDILGAGGFLITNNQPELHDYFQMGVDLEIYHSMDELTDKVLYYLQHDTERKAIAARGREKCFKYFSFERQLTRMLQLAGVINFGREIGTLQK